MTSRENGIGLMGCTKVGDKIGQNRKVQRVLMTVGAVGGFCIKRIRESHARNREHGTSERDRVHCTKNLTFLFPEMKLRGLLPISTFMYL
jgi:hypothetical protein